MAAVFVASSSRAKVAPPVVAMMQDAEVLAYWFGGQVGRGLVLVLFPYGLAGELLAEELDTILQELGVRG